MEARGALLNTASKIAEDTRVQIRKLKDTIMRKYKWKPRSEEGEQVGYFICHSCHSLMLMLVLQFQKLCDTHIKKVDQILATAKQELGA